MQKKIMKHLKLIKFIEEIGKIISRETLFVHFSTDYVFDGLKTLT